MTGTRGRTVSDLEFEVPLVPPSVNHYKVARRDGRYYVTGEAKKFKQAVGMCARFFSVYHSYYTVEIIVTLGPGAKMDLDNAAKVVLDGLVENGQIHSDAAITRLVLTKRRGASGRTVIKISRGNDP